MPDFDPFRAATAEPAPTCPKCGYSPVSAPACEACGLIFERYAAAQRRAQVQALEPVTPSVLPTTPMAVVGHREQFAQESASGIVGAASASSLSTLLTQLGLNLIPFGLLLVLVFVGAAGVAIFAKVLASVGMAVVVVLGLVVLLLVSRLAAAVATGTMLVVDEHMRTGDNRGVVAALGDGWALSGRVVGVALLITAGVVGPLVPLGFIANKTTAVPFAVVGIAWVAWFGLRTMLAMPAAVLGGSDVGDALSSSWQLTAGRFRDTAKVALLACLVIGAISGIGAGIGLVPVVGQIIGAVISIFVGGVYAGVCAGLWRAREDR